MAPDHDVRHIGPAPAGAEQPTPRAFYDQSWALVIGISDYQDPQARLANARNDAEAVAKLLKETYHFEHVTLLCDAEATHAAIMSWLRDQLPDRVGSNDRFVFFFAGHGVSRTGSTGQVRGYLMPQDAERSKYASYIDMEEVRNACGWIGAKHIFLILDCCFSGIAAVTTRATPPARPKQVTDAYLQRITELTAWQVLTAGAADELVADSGTRPGHSVFTGALLGGLEGWADDDGDGIITASDLAEYVQQTVSHETASGRTRQFPYFNYLMGSGQGNLVFTRPVQPIALPPDRSVPPNPVPMPRWKGWLSGVVAGLRRRWIWVLSVAVLLTAVGIYWGLTTRYKQTVIARMGSSEYGAALAAVEVASRRGWLSDGSLRGADLQDANLQGADLLGASLTSAKYDATTRWPVGFDYRNTGAIGPGANLQGVNLQGAILRGVILYGADLRGANLRDADLQDALYDSSTIWPEGYIPPAEAIRVDR